VDMGVFGVHGHIRIGQRTATMISSRGCPYGCSFCSSRLTMGRGYRMHSPEYVVAEIEMLARQYGVDSIVFEDDTFTVNPERAARICDLLLERKLGIQWYCLSRVDRITRPLVEHMQRAGCRMVNFGIESGVQENLDRIGKKITLEDARRAVRTCDEVGLRTQGTFVIGFPFDTPETIRRTLAFARELPLTVAIFFPLTPYPGTACWDYLAPEQRPQTLDEWRRYVVGIAESPVSFVDGLTPRDLQRMANRGHLRFYLRPAQAWRMLKTVRSPNELAGYAENALALGVRFVRSLGA
jgi:anaerobic magnesium-protoporphyrin IX monomethyl ester cyclase